MSWTQQLGLKWPILQAPMAGAQGVAMAAAVSNAGGLGAIPSALLSSEELDEALREFRRATSGASPAPVNVNFFTHVNPPEDSAAQARWRKALAPYYAEFDVEPPTTAGAGRNPFDAVSCKVLERHRPEVVSFHFGLPEAALLERVKAWGALVLSSATTVEEAVWLEAHGADVIIAQGLEAGAIGACFSPRTLPPRSAPWPCCPKWSMRCQCPSLQPGESATLAPWPRRWRSAPQRYSAVRRFCAAPRA